MNDTSKVNFIDKLSKPDVAAFFEQEAKKPQSQRKHLWQGLTINDMLARSSISKEDELSLRIGEFVANAKFGCKNVFKCYFLRTDGTLADKPAVKLTIGSGDNKFKSEFVFSSYFQPSCEKVSNQLSYFPCKPETLPFIMNRDQYHAIETHIKKALENKTLDVLDDKYLTEKSKDPLQTNEPIKVDLKKWRKNAQLLENKIINDLPEQLQPIATVISQIGAGNKDKPHELMKFITNKIEAMPKQTLEDDDVNNVTKCFRVLTTIMTYISNFTFVRYFIQPTATEKT